MRSILKKCIRTQPRRPMPAELWLGARSVGVSSSSVAARVSLLSSARNAVADDSPSSTTPLGDAIETFIRREHAERFVEEVRRANQSSPVTCGAMSTGRAAATQPMSVLRISPQ
jgi:hypothetical protein